MRLRSVAQGDNMPGKLLGGYTWKDHLDPPTRSGEGLKHSSGALLDFNDLEALLRFSPLEGHVVHNFINICVKELNRIARQRARRTV
jgi:hypothetical protein